MSTFVPLKPNAVLRETTASEETLLRSVMMSSLMPSLKYSCSASPLMLTKGRAQIETRFVFTADAAGAEPGGGFPACGALLRAIIEPCERWTSWYGGLGRAVFHWSDGVG